MPFVRAQFVRPRCTALVAVVLALGVDPARLLGEAPHNPLRPVPMEPINTERAISEAPRVELASETMADAQPTFPGGLSQPELLPPPAEMTKGDGFELLGPGLESSESFDQFVHPLFAEPWFAHSDPNDPARHIGIGQPLVGTSWRNRPWYFGTFVGGVLMDDLVPNRIYQNDTTFVGARLGYDFDHYWGLEGRWAFARPDLENSLGNPIYPASRDNFGDVSLVVYPLGDARWRPYVSAGLGFTTFRFNNEVGQRISEAAVDVPLAFGVKYFYGPWFTLRFDFTDNWILGNARVSGMHNVSLMVGAEFRFGGRRPSYFPWHNNTAYW